jgi:AsmA protein
MGKLGKIFGIIILLAVVAIAGLIAFVHFYLTDDRVKALVIPQAKAALGREVAIGDIKIGLLSGITITDFIVKEADNKTDFVSTKAFVLSYELLPLLQKKLIISELRFDEPTVQIIRDKKGNFNFSTLAILADKPQEKKAEKAQPVSAALPLALTINQIKLNKAKIRIRDQLNEIPAVDATSSAKLNVVVGRTMNDLLYNGSFDFDAAVGYGDTQTKLNGKGNISQKDMAVVLDTNLDGEQVHAEADVKSFMQSPNATIAITSKSLNVDKLLGIVAGLPAPQADKTQKPREAKSKSGDIIAKSLPPGLVAQGSMQVDKAIYKGLAVNNFSMAFDLAKGILSVKELSAKAYGGKLNSNMTVDLNQPNLAYDGKLGLQSVQAGDLTSALGKKLAGMLAGTLQSDMTFSGAGTAWQQISNALTADGSFTLSDGSIKGTPVSASIANLLGLQELNNISYKNISGTFKIVEGGKLKIKTNLQGTDLDAETEGMIGLDGSLDLPLTFHLSPALADKLRARASFAKYLTDEKGGATLHLKLAGTVKKPQPTLDMKGVQEQLQKSLQNEVLKKLDSSGQQSGEKSSPENIIRGLFGK